MLTPDNTVLLVIDIQERLVPSICNHEAMVQATAACISGCKLLGVPIIVMQQYTKGLGETVSDLREALGEFTPVEKITFSAFQNVEFLERLPTDRKNVLVVGIEAHICVQMTVLELHGDGHDSGYNVYVVADCIGSRNDANRVYAVERMRQAGAVITPLESALFEMLVRADHPARKEITKLVVGLG